MRRGQVVRCRLTSVVCEPPLEIGHVVNNTTANFEIVWTATGYAEVDPPRCGCKEILEYIPLLGIRHIIYVSCSLPTLARDLKILSQLGYQIDIIQPIDMFPQTHHVECVVSLNKK